MIRDGAAILRSLEALRDSLEVAARDAGFAVNELRAWLASEKEKA